ncbi:MAG TPA: M20 family metallo-hydrolase, partial [Thermomicrobiales bacterium]|nr:M20 family metallo-hydrolase [Thermomicrobiales bacterium]
MQQPLSINVDRLHASLAELARIGATPAGGVTRLALSDEDRQARDLLCTWLRDAGLDPNVDDVGNISAIRPGRDAGPPVLLGSHIDTVVRGGKFDGALGVMGALEVIRTLNDNGIETRLPVGLVSWTNEEGVRFEPAMTCSGVVTGRFTPEYVGERMDRAGLRFADELARIGYQGDAANRPLPATAYLELHIEQGPVLEARGLPAGVVGGIVGITWNEVTVSGQTDHAGPSPMHLRHDALTAAAEIILGVEQIAKQRDETAVATVGRIAAQPNVINTIPGEVIFSVDFRHSDPAILEGQVQRLHELVDHVASRRGVEVAIERFWTSEPTPFDPNVQAAIRDAATAFDIAVGELWSGAGHDAKYLADVCPSGMIFVRREGGLSHCETEYSTTADIEAG